MGTSLPNEHRIAAAELIDRLPAILDDVATSDAAYRVTIPASPNFQLPIRGVVNSDGDAEFVLGDKAADHVFPLIDKEYGWPHPIQLTEIRSALDLLPRWHHHPEIWQGNQCRGICVSLAEYESLLQRD